VGVGAALYAKGKVDEAIAEFREAIRLNKNNAEAHSNLGAALRSKGHLDEAIAEHREAIRLHKNYAAAHSNLGAALESKGQTDEAISEFREAIRLDKNYAKAHSNLGAALASKGRTDEAISEFREAIRLKQNYAIAYSNLAWVFATCADPKMRDPAQAVELAKKAVALDPNKGDSWNTLGVAQYRAGDWKAAITALEKSMELRKGGDANDWFFLAMAHWQRGDKKDARNWYDRAVMWMEKHQPRNEELLRFRAEAETLLELKK
jgi:Flp pilus assembly protein TadD